MGRTQRALELQQLAAGSVSLLESSQLSAAAQRCTEQAQTAAQIAKLARAEAERLSEKSPEPEMPANGPCLGPSSDSPASELSTGQFGLGLLAPDPVPGLSADGPAPDVSRLEPASATIDFESPHIDVSTASASASTAAGLNAASSAAADPAAARDDSQAPAGHHHHQLASRMGAASGLSHHSVEFIHSLSSEMQAAMQQLVATASGEMPGVNPARSRHSGMSLTQLVPQLAVSQSQGVGHTDLGISQSSLGRHDSPLGTDASQQAPVLPYHAPWTFPNIEISSGLESMLSPELPELPHQATEINPRDEGPSGMQLHLMHQLEGLERSVRRVEQQVSSTKQTRRRLKTTSLPPQVRMPVVNPEQVHFPSPLPFCVKCPADPTRGFQQAEFCSCKFI